jgi:hypothetical protein
MIGYERFLRRKTRSHERLVPSRINIPGSGTGKAFTVEPPTHKLSTTMLEA